MTGVYIESGSSLLVTGVYIEWELSVSDRSIH